MNICYTFLDLENLPAYQSETIMNDDVVIEMLIYFAHLK